jgi:hypothetical protein
MQLGNGARALGASDRRNKELERKEAGPAGGVGFDSHSLSGTGGRGRGQPRFCTSVAHFSHRIFGLLCVCGEEGRKRKNVR